MKIPSGKMLAILCVSALFAGAQFVQVADARGGRKGGGTHTNMSGHHAKPAHRGDINRGHANRGNGNRNRIERNNVNRNVNYHGGHNNIDIDVDRDWDRGHWDDHWHPVATAAAVGATVAVTRAIVGSRVYVLPSTGCQTYPYSGTSYYVCGDDWYEPQYVGTQVTYVVVRRPY